MKTDIEIAQECKLERIEKIAASLNIDEEYLENYGKYKAKISNDLYKDLENKKDGKLILVTAINPTAAGEGKTTTTIGLADGLKALNKKVVVALREPSLGPVFGVKGGAAGGGYAQVVPMEDINLHFTGDFHAIGAANNLLSAMIDNHLQQGNELHIDPRRIVWKRCVDMNDRALRKIVVGLGGKANGVTREDGYDITVASEIMAIFCLAKDIKDLKERISKIIVAYTYDNKPVYVKDLKAEGAMAALLKDAIKPNLVQTLEKTPVLIHGGPFANIAHGCNSVIASKLALKLGDYVVTEAGFGADLGAEKFLDIKCRKANLKPSAVVLVATIRALKLHGGANKKQLADEDLLALEKGLPNLLGHLENIKNVYKLPCIVALNHFASDSQKEIDLVMEKCKELNVDVCLADGFLKGSKGMLDLANKVVDLVNEDNDFTFAYDENDSIIDKLNAIATKIYHADGIELSSEAKKDLKIINELGYDKLPICVAKTQYSFSDNPLLLGAPKGFKLNVKQLKISAGAGFIVALTGDIMTMPGLPKTPAAINIDVDEEGKITGLF